jgi:hypothetical protein
MAVFYGVNMESTLGEVQVLLRQPSISVRNKCPPLNLVSKGVDGIPNITNGEYTPTKHLSNKQHPTAYH